MESVEVRFSYLDTKTALFHLCDDEDFYMEIIGEFIQDDKREELNGYVVNSDWNNYQILIHGLKTMAKTIGAMELSERAKLLEERVKKGNVTDIIQEHQEVMDMYTELLDRLSVSLRKE